MTVPDDDTLPDNLTGRGKPGRERMLAAIREAAIGYYDRLMHNLGRSSYMDFLINRTARVWPLHLIVTLVFMARILVNVSGTQAIPLDLPNTLTNLLMIQSWGWGTQPIAGNSWSVSTEVAAYLLYPLIAIMASMGLSLTADDFRQVFRNRRALIQLAPAMTPAVARHKGRPPI